jgi:hypothetical protein
LNISTNSTEGKGEEPNVKLKLQKSIEVVNGSGYFQGCDSTQPAGFVLFKPWGWTAGRYNKV